MCKLDGQKYDNINQLISDVNKISGKYGLRKIKSQNSDLKEKNKFNKIILMAIIVMVVAFIAMAVLLLKEYSDWQIIYDFYEEIRDNDFFIGGN